LKQVPPFKHGSEMHSSTSKGSTLIIINRPNPLNHSPCSQTAPMYPKGHTQENPPWRSIQVPSFLQGKLWQSSISVQKQLHCIYYYTTISLIPYLCISFGPSSQNQGNTCTGRSPECRCIQSWEDRASPCTHRRWHRILLPANPPSNPRIQSVRHSVS
jgi:hypothetical protein